MPGQDGFDVLAALPEEERPHVVFVTAHDRHAVRAFRVHALDYLVKPIDDERFEETLARAIRHGRPRAGERPRPAGGRRSSRSCAGGVARGARAAARELAGPCARGEGHVRPPRRHRLGRGGGRLRAHPRGRSLAPRPGDDGRGRAAAPGPGGSCASIARRSSTWSGSASSSSLENGDWAVRLQSGDTLRLSRTRRDAVERLTGRDAADRAPPRPAAPSPRLVEKRVRGAAPRVPLPGMERRDRVRRRRRGSRAARRCGCFRGCRGRAPRRCRRGRPARP